MTKKTSIIRKIREQLSPTTCGVGGQPGTIVCTWNYGTNSEPGKKHTHCKKVEMLLAVEKVTEYEIVSDRRITQLCPQLVTVLIEIKLL